jgi:hypothetical protein
MGVAHEGNKSKIVVEKRKAFKNVLRSLMSKVLEMNADDAADEMGKKMMWDSLPPCLTRKEKEVTVEDDGEFMVDGRVRNRVEIDPDVEVKLIRKNCVRLVREDGNLRLYFSTENPLIYHKEEPQFMELSEQLRAPVEHLITAYPAFTRVEDLPLNDEEMKVHICVIMFIGGIRKIVLVI